MKIIFIGGGHAHLESLLKVDKFLEKNHEVKLISPSPYTYYSGMGPGLLGGIFEPQEIRFNVKELVENGGGRFIEDSVRSINPKNKTIELKSNKKLEYDIISVDIGSKIKNLDIISETIPIVPVKPIENLFKAKETVLSSKVPNNSIITIVGGGPAGIEIASNLRVLLQNNEKIAKIRLFSETQILHQHPDKVRQMALEILHKQEIEVFEDKRIAKIEGNLISIENGPNMETSFIFIAIGISPNNIWKNSDILIDEEGAMIVNKNLQSIKYPNIFGGGDCIQMKNYKLDKVGVYAVRENPILYHNIMNFAENKKLRDFKPQNDYLLILNMGNKYGIAWKGDIVIGGKLSYHLKNLIDKRFMKKFQI